ALWTSASRLTSVCTYATRAPSSTASRAPWSSWMSAISTDAPSRAKRRTVPSPMPLAPPVMRATLLARRLTTDRSRATATERRAAPALERRELRHRLALELGELLHGPAQRHDGGDGHVLGNVEQLLDLRLLGHRPRGEWGGENPPPRRP